MQFSLFNLPNHIFSHGWIDVPLLKNLPFYVFDVPLLKNLPFYVFKKMKEIPKMYYQIRALSTWFPPLFDVKCGETKIRTYCCDINIYIYTSLLWGFVWIEWCTEQITEILVDTAEIWNATFMSTSAFILIAVLKASKAAFINSFAESAHWSADTSQSDQKICYHIKAIKLHHSYRPLWLL